MYLGDEAFVDAMLAKLETDAPLDDVTTTHHRPPPKPIDHYAKLHNSRDEVIAAAYASGGYSMKVFGEHFGLGYSMVSRIVNRR